MFLFGLTTPASGPYPTMRPTVRPTLRHGPRLRVTEAFIALAATGEIPQHCFRIKGRARGLLEQFGFARIRIHRNHECR